MVQWSDSTTQRPGWEIRLANVGASLRSINVVNADDMSGCWIAVEPPDGPCAVLLLSSEASQQI